MLAISYIGSVMMHAIGSDADIGNDADRGGESSGNKRSD